MTTAQTAADDEEQHLIKCTVCEFSRDCHSKVHAHAVGRQHYHGESHPVLYDNGEDQ